MPRYQPNNIPGAHAFDAASPSAQLSKKKVPVLELTDVKGHCSFFFKINFFGSVTLGHDIYHLFLKDQYKSTKKVYIKCFLARTIIVYYRLYTHISKSSNLLDAYNFGILNQIPVDKLKEILEISQLFF